MKRGNGLARNTPLEAKTGLGRGKSLTARVPLQRSAPPAFAPRSRSRRSQGRQRATPVPPAVRLAVYRRDEDTCVRCGCPALEGNRSLQHRRPRASGGHADPHTMSNLILVHGALGTVGCHGEIEQRRPEEYERGYVLHWWQEPLDVPVLSARHGWVYLTDEGDINRVELLK